jgi:hypothetical protein
MIEYYSSTLNPDCYFAALDNVIVAIWLDQWGWHDRCLYQPIRKHYQKAVWSGTPYDPKTLVNPKEWEYVKQNGRCYTGDFDEIRAYLARMKEKYP